MARGPGAPLATGGGRLPFLGKNSANSCITSVGSVAANCPCHQPFTFAAPCAWKALEELGHAGFHSDA
jgi:hypothetical protein